MKIMVAPQKVGTALPHNMMSIKRMGLRAVGLTEMDLGARTGIPVVRRILGKNWFISSNDRGQHSQEIPTAVRTGMFCHVLHHKTVALSPNVGTAGVGNDRWLNITYFKRFRKTYVIFMVHTDAVVQSHQTYHMLDNHRTRVTERAMKIIEEEAYHVLHEPDVTGLFILGDFNIIPIGEGKSVSWGPHMMFERLHMRYDNSRVVYLAWAGVKLNGVVNEIPAHSDSNWSDHGWLVGDFR